MARLVGRRITRATALEQGGGPRRRLRRLRDGRSGRGRGVGRVGAAQGAVHSRRVPPRQAAVGRAGAEKGRKGASGQRLAPRAPRHDRRLVLQDTVATPYKNFTVDETVAAEIHQARARIRPGPAARVLRPAPLRPPPSARRRSARRQPPLNALAADFPRRRRSRPRRRSGPRKGAGAAILLDQPEAGRRRGQLGGRRSALPRRNPRPVGAVRHALARAGGRAPRLARRRWRDGGPGERRLRKVPGRSGRPPRWRNQTSGTFSSPIGVIKFDTVGGRTTAWRRRRACGRGGQEGGGGGEARRAGEVEER